MQRKTLVLTLVLVVLTVMTIVYGIALYQSVQAYEMWKESEIQWCNEKKIFPSDARLWLDFYPYWRTFEGGLAIGFGAVLAFSWVVLGVSSHLNWKVGRKKLQT